MIELTNEQILILNDSLTKLEENKVILNIKASYKLARAKKIVQSFVNTIQQEQMKLYQKYGEKEEDKIRIPAEKLDDFTKEYEELLQIKNNIEINPIQLEDFGEVEMDLQVMQGLMSIVED